MDEKRHKVVYNLDFGGFRLDEDAVEYIRKRGINIDEWGEILDEDGNATCEYIERHNPILVECVEKFGVRLAGAKSAMLAITEIKGDLYRIDWNDGMETVITPEDEDWIKGDWIKDDQIKIEE